MCTSASTSACRRPRRPWWWRPRRRSWSCRRRRSITRRRCPTTTSTTAGSTTRSTTTTGSTPRASTGRGPSSRSSACRARSSPCRSATTTCTRSTGRSTARRPGPDTAGGANTNMGTGTARGTTSTTTTEAGRQRSLRLLAHRNVCQPGRRMLDLVLRGGGVCAGSGGSAHDADVGIEAGRIVAIGRTGGVARRTLDVRGLIVAPGFVDVHTHYDAQVTWDRLCTPSCWHGVTSVVIGNCGFALAPCRPSDRERLLRMLEHVEGMPFESLHAGIAWEWESFAEYVRALGARPLGVNVGALLGHSALRAYVMGDGAYTRAARAGEVETMAALVREGMVAGALGFYPQVSCRPMRFDFDLATGCASLDAMPCWRRWRAAPSDAARLAVLSDTDFRAAVKAEALGRADAPASRRWGDVVLEEASRPEHAPFVGRTLAEIAAARGGDAIDALLALSAAEDLRARFSMLLVNYDEDHVGMLLGRPESLIALSDAGAHVSVLCDAGYATHLLGHWVRERGLFGWEEAVRRLTAMPAAIYGIPERGLLAPERVADVVCFDPARVAARAPEEVRDVPGGELGR